MLSRDRHLIPLSVVDGGFIASAFASGSTELLEEELDVCFFSLVSESPYPVEIHRPSSMTALTADDKPIQCASV